MGKTTDKKNYELLTQKFYFREVCTFGNWAHTLLVFSAIYRVIYTAIRQIFEFEGSA